MFELKGTVTLPFNIKLGFFSLTTLLQMQFAYILYLCTFCAKCLDLHYITIHISNTMWKGSLNQFTVCDHTTYSWNIKRQKCAGMGLNGFIFKKINENENIKMKKKSREPFRSCLLKSHQNWAELTNPKRLPGFFFLFTFWF